LQHPIDQQRADDSNHTSDDSDRRRIVERFAAHHFRDRFRNPHALFFSPSARFIIRSTCVYLSLEYTDDFLGRANWPRVSLSSDVFLPNKENLYSFLSKTTQKQNQTRAADRYTNYMCMCMRVCACACVVRALLCEEQPRVVLNQYNHLGCQACFP